MATKISTKTVLKALAQSHREAERQRQVQIRAHQKALKDAEKARENYFRAQAQAQKTGQKELERLHVEMQIADVENRNSQLEADIERINKLLHETLSVDDYLDIEKLKKVPLVPTFRPSVQKPTLEMF
jgi:restriction system protein